MPPAEQRVCLVIRVLVVAFDANSWPRRGARPPPSPSATIVAFVRFVFLGGAPPMAAEAAEGPGARGRGGRITRRGWARRARCSSATRAAADLEAARLRAAAVGAVTAGAALFTYAWAVVGMQLFSEDMAYVAATEHFECAEPFASPGCCGLLLFQVMAGEDWDELLHGMREAAVEGLLYVLGFFVVVNICLISLMVALAINAFLAAKADFIEQASSSTTPAPRAAAAAAAPPAPTTPRAAGRRG